MSIGQNSPFVMKFYLEGLYEFHVSRHARDLYNFDEDLFSLHGQVLFANFHAARRFAHRINIRRDLVHFPEQAIKVGEINAMGLIDEIMHIVVGLYRLQNNPALNQEALAWISDRSGAKVLQDTLLRFTNEFPPISVYRREISSEDYLGSQSLGVANIQISLEEMAMLWLANSNPAYSPFGELFNDSDMEKRTAYLDIIAELQQFFTTQPKFGPFDQNLIDMLRSPAITVPNSIPGQLEYIREHWGYLLGDHLFRLLSGLDLIREEEKATFTGRGPAVGLDLSELESDRQHYSMDRDWMPELVLMAKNIYVWLDQLSKQFNREIKRLDEIPDEILDQLARWGITGIWLIGVWERSQASRKIKQLTGNPEAQASAYSLYDYQIAEDLGGEQALLALRDRAWQRGIRLGSDMVPNHMGVDSRWVIEKPEWFISLPENPFPAYTFEGTDLSSVENIGLFVEDHYYDRSDASVVFKRVDRNTGQSKFIYHGNDGTSMPWNDTAQLDYLNPMVREGVIQTIMHVARLFPVIRFDAAMTLTKKHYQRLWFPTPGTGGSIPTRAEYGMTKAEFDRVMPLEFWRELVDRVAQEAPDTLLLAEAFWMMEGYFVRTLGMHRVYNSAFMNMLRDEDNANYREVIKQTLEFDPQILKRFVNFMSNPDEETANEQFGEDGKYFGVCTLMVTLPGLPMFAHGQIEGYVEKYGMEYHRAKWDEKPNPGFIDQHAHQIFPLLKQRHLFAHVEHFQFYDFFISREIVNEDVFAYSNCVGDERALIAYNNRYTKTSGRIRTSTMKSDMNADGHPRLQQVNLCHGLNLRTNHRYFTIFEDQLTGLEYIRNNQELYQSGLYLDFEAYSRYVFLNFREVADNEWHHYAHLEEFLAGRGVPSIDQAMQETFLQPIHEAFQALVSLQVLGPFIDVAEIRKSKSVQKNASVQVQPDMDAFERLSNNLYSAITDYVDGDANPSELASDMRTELKAIIDRANILPSKVSDKKVNTAYQKVIEYLNEHPDGRRVRSTIELIWLCCYPLGRVLSAHEAYIISRSWMDEWQLNRLVATSLEAFGITERRAWQIIRLVNIMIMQADWYSRKDRGSQSLENVIEAWLSDTDIQEYIGINRYQGVLWFHKESFDDFLRWMFWLATFQLRRDDPEDRERVQKEILNAYEMIRRIADAAERSGYRIDKFMEIIKS